MREEVTITNKPRKNTPTQPVIGNATHISEELNQSDGQTVNAKSMLIVINLINKQI